MAEYVIPDSFSSTGIDEGVILLKQEPDMELLQTAEIGSDDDEDEGNLEKNSTVKQLLNKVQLLEQQVAACLQNQPLVYQLFTKCNGLEQRLKNMKKDIDGRLDEITCGRAGPVQRPIPRVKSKSSVGVHKQNDGDDSDEGWQPESEQSDDDDLLPKQGKLAPTSDTLVAEGNLQARTKILDQKIVHGPVSKRRMQRESSPSPEKEHPCPDGCGRSFDTPSQLKRHIVSCRRLRLHNCDECSFSCGFAWNLKLHKKSKHGDGESKTAERTTGAADPEVVEVGVAEVRKVKVIKRRRRYNNILHQKSSEPRRGRGRPRSNETAPKEYQCPDGCGRTFDKASLLKRHLVTCRKLRLHNCDKCSFSCGFEWNLKLHKKAKHMDLEPGSGNGRHFCEHCGKGFFKLKLLQVHIRRHTGERPFACLTCSTKFISQSTLRNHMQLHEAKLVCEECGRSFSRAWSLKVHKRSHQKSLTSTETGTEAKTVSS